MAKAKLQQIRLTSGSAAQPPFPGGWVLAVFAALNAFAPALGRRFKLPICRRTEVRIKGAKPVKQRSYDEIEAKLVELITALFPNVSAVNGFAKKYVDEYFRLWKGAGEIGPTWVRHLGLRPGKSSVLGRAFVRDLVLRLCYLENCERRLNKQSFSEAELAFLQHDSPAQVYRLLILKRARLRKISIEKLAEHLGVTEKSLHRVKGGKSLPTFKLLSDLQQPDAGHRLVAGIGFVDQLLKSLRLHKSVLRHELLAIASVFFRHHPLALETFKAGRALRTKSGETRVVAFDFERFAAFGDGLLLHPGFNELWPEIPDALWRCHLYTLQFGCTADLAQAYFQFSAKANDSQLEAVLIAAEHESNGCRHRWMDRLRLHKND